MSSCRNPSVGVVVSGSIAVSVGRLLGGLDGGLVDDGKIPKTGATGFSIGVVVIHGALVEKGVKSVVKDPLITDSKSLSKLEDDAVDGEKVTNVPNISRDRGT